MFRHLIIVFLFLLTNFSFSQRTVVLTQNQSNAVKGIDRKAWKGLGDVSGHSDGYANDFTLPTRMNPCEKITNVKVNINITNYNKTSGCPHNNTYFNLLYGCSTYSGGATCPTSNVIYENSYSVNPPVTTLNFNTSDPRYNKLDFGRNLSVDIIPVSTPSCNPVTNGGLTYEYTTTVTVTIAEDLPTTPAFTQVAAVCSGATITALPTTSNNGIPGTWSPALDNTATKTYTFTPAVGQCATSTTMTITVNPKTSPNFNPVAAVCSGATIAALPTTSNNGIPGTWSPALNNLATTTYTFTPAAGQCANNASLTITVIPKTTPNFNPVAAVCSGTTIAALPTSSNDGIPGTWAPALNNLATTPYTFTPAAGQCANNASLTITVIPKPTPTFTPVAAVCSGATIAALPTSSNNGIPGTWSPALNNLATTTYTFTPAVGECATSTTMTITVNPKTTPTFTQVSPVCLGTTIAALPTTSNNGIPGTWSPALDNTATKTYTFTPEAGQCATSTTMTITVIPKTSPNFNPVAAVCSGTTVAPLPTSSNNGIPGTWAPALDNTATKTYTFTPAVGQCATSTTMTITVNPKTSPNFNPVAAVCSGTTIAALPTSSLNGIPGTWAPALDNLATTTYTFTPAVGECATSTTMTITVNPKTTPTFTPVAAVCSGTTIAALPTTSNDGIPGTWAPALDNTATKTYTFTPAVGQCATSTTMTITVNPKTSPNFNPVAAVCSGTTIAALPTSSNNGIPGTWAPALDNLATTTYTFTPAVGECATSTTMTITINPDPFLKPTLKDGKICIEKATGNTLKPYRIETNLNNPNFEFKWYFENVKIDGATQNWYEASAIGNYSVLVYNKLTGCTSIEAFATMTETFPANSYTIEQTAAFTDNSAITITVDGSINDYRYKIDNGPWQNSNVFLGVSSGLHTIHITDIEGCTSFTDTVTIINYPKFFTPNGDGFNDIWNVVGFGINSNAKLSIFDQYGKLIKQISSDETGWDGTFNNQMLPATDYWFTIQYSENMIEKLFKAHFSLKR